MKRRDFVAAGSLLLASLAFGALAQSREQPQGGQNDVAAIPRFLRLSGQVWTGGQPTPDQLPTLKQEGVRAVINLRPHTEGNGEGVREAARLKELDVPSFNVPVDYASPQSEDADAFLKITDEQLKNGPVFIHCAAAVRVGAFWMIRRVLRDGWDTDRALEEAHKIGLGSQQHLLEFARDYIDKNKGK